MINKILFLIISATSLVTAQNFGSMSFTTYADDRQSAFSLTFDDGLLTHYENARPILNQYGFKGTFYVLPPFLTESLPGMWRYGTWPGFQLMASEGHEIGSHTMNHDTLPTLPWGDINAKGTLLYELYQSKIFIEQKIPQEKCISLNYPYTLHNSFVDSAANLFYENGRTLGQTPNDSSLTQEEWYGLKAKVVEFSLPRNSVTDDLDELYTFLEWTQNSIDSRKWGMIIIHDVVPAFQLPGLVGQGIYEPISNEWLTSLCDFLWARSSNKDVWVETVGNITRYIKERDAVNYQIISSSEQLIEINVTDDLPNSVYDYPLSAYVKIPDTWQYVRAEQNGTIDTLTTTLTDTGRVVLVTVIPDNGVLRISPVGLISVNDNDTNVNEFMLYQNYPNPFNPATYIQYKLGEKQFVTLKVFDVLGNEVATLVDEEKAAGMYNVEFKIQNYNLSSGGYLYKLQAGDFIQTRKMILLK